MVASAEGFYNRICCSSLAIPFCGDILHKGGRLARSRWAGSQHHEPMTIEGYLMAHHGRVFKAQIDAICLGLLSNGDRSPRLAYTNSKASANR